MHKSQKILAAADALMADGIIDEIATDADAGRLDMRDMGIDCAMIAQLVIREYERLGENDS